MNENISNPLDISKELLDLAAQRSPAELPAICGFSKKIELKIKTLFF